jgi:hypothetical protein
MRNRLPSPEQDVRIVRGVATVNDIVGGGEDASGFGPDDDASAQPDSRRDQPEKACRTLQGPIEIGALRSFGLQTLQQGLNAADGTCES